METPDKPTPTRRLAERLAAHRVLSRVVPSAVLFGILLGFLWMFLFSAPADFGAPRLVRIEQGMNIKEAGALLEEMNLVRHRDAFVLSALVLGGEKSLIAGDYYFPGAQNAVIIANRLTLGDYELEPVKVTLPEGATVREMARILSQKLEFFDATAFITLAEGKEGYLFPDTYYFLPTEDAEVVLRALEANFHKRFKPLEDELAASGRTLHEIVTMASLLEEEARTLPTRKMISGVLWRRIEIGMKLQVDAVFPYIIGKNTFEVTLDDLAVDSPYNTYRYKGLPLGPISNPGLSAIEAALQPTESPYLYYLADMQGVTHYSKTYAEHLRKQKLYLGS